MAAPKAFSIIDHAMTVEGDVHVDGCLVIRGHLRGCLRAEHVVVAREGRVSGRLAAGRIDVAGTVEGDIEALGPVHVMPTGSCGGQLRCQTLWLEAGGTLDAAVVCTPAASGQTEASTASAPRRESDRRGSVP